jgi:serine/threonine-protein phosphatase PGAM5
MARTQLYLVRHGEQDPASGHEPDGGLSQLGREQADLLGRRLRGVAFSAIHHSPSTRAAQTADVIAGHLPHVPRHACDFVADRTPVPSAGQRDRYPDRYLAWLDGVPDDERDEDAVALQAAVEHFGVVGGNDRRELLITHNFVIGWFVRHVLDAPVWRWIGLNQANCALTIVQWESGRAPTLVSFNDSSTTATGP